MTNGGYMTNGLISVMQGSSVVLKIVVGCDGFNVRKCAERLISLWPDDSPFETHERWLALWANNMAHISGFGCVDCRVVLTENTVRADCPSDLPHLYRDTFDDPHFNPRWELGTAPHVVIINLDRMEVTDGRE